MKFVMNFIFEIILKKLCFDITTKNIKRVKDISLAFIKKKLLKY